MKSKLFSAIRGDWTANPRNWKAHIVLVLYRTSHEIAVRRYTSPVLWAFGIPFLMFYRVLVEWFLGIEIPAKTDIGVPLRLFHGQGLVVNDHSIIGRNCVLRHCTTIGHSLLEDGSAGPSPIIGDDVEIGSNVCIIGAIQIGDRVRVGAGSVVVKDVPSGAVVVGNPARIVKVVEQVTC